ncbi:hypothetical protein WMF37_33065 [Sorangium sp. So ce291]|uniref:hypothetical protein n=1 Tax=Sorangium sp. So ce291 TaxID=3133294 RepID=UPI003F5E303A
MRRLCYAFSKKFENHRAAASLYYVAYALLTEPAGEPPMAPGAHSSRALEPSAPARKLPSGRGWLRLVTEPTPRFKRPHRAPEPPPASPPVQAAPPPLPDPPRAPVQLDLFSWKPDPSDTPEG